MLLEQEVLGTGILALPEVQEQGILTEEVQASTFSPSVCMFQSLLKNILTSSSPFYSEQFYWQVVQMSETFLLEIHLCFRPSERV